MFYSFLQLMPSLAKLTHLNFFRLKHYLRFSFKKNIFVVAEFKKIWKSTKNTIGPVKHMKRSKKNTIMEVTQTFIGGDAWRVCHSGLQWCKNSFNFSCFTLRCLLVSIIHLWSTLLSPSLLRNSINLTIICTLWKQF